MKKVEKILIKILPIFFIITFVIMPNFGFAGWFGKKITEVEGGKVISGQLQNTTDDVMKTGIDVANTIGKGLATIMLIVIGIKYLLASPEGRAEYKKTLVPYVAGAILVFFAGDIVKWFDGGSISKAGDKLNNEVNSAMNSGIKIARTIGKAMATIMLIVIGIKYMSSSPEGKAEYRKTITPYIAGALLVFLVDSIVGWFDGGDIASVGNQINTEVNNVMIIGKNVVNIVGTAMATIMLLVLGIKYMSSSPEGKAEYRKTAIPYLVGAIIVFASSKIIAWIQGMNSTYNANIQVVDSTTRVMGTIITAAQYIGFGTALLMIIVLAIKYMTAAPEGKAEIQKTSTTYIIGAVVLFSFSAILGIIQGVAGSI